MKYQNKLWGTICLILILAVSCKQSTTTNSSNEISKASLQLSWVPEVGSSGEIVGKTLYKDSCNLDLDIRSGGEGLDPIKSVISGTSTFGIVSSDKIFAANDKGADLVIIGTIHYHHPGVFLSKKELSIENPQDWVGKKVGVLPAGDMEYLYRAMLKVNSLETSSFTEVTCPFDLRTFIDDQYDVRPAFVYDEPVVLDKQGIEYEIIHPKDYGVSFRGKSYFCTRETIAKNPQLVQSFVNMVALGWKHVLTNPERSMNILAKFDESVVEQDELSGLKIDRSYFEGMGGKVLFCDIASWEAMAKQLKDLSVIKEINIEEMIDNSFIENFHTE